MTSRSLATAKAIILAAGRGERLRPWTDHTPKPLLKVRGKALIEWQLEALARAGVSEVVINTAWLEHQLPAALGDGERHGLHIRYSMEGRDHGAALETAGGIAKALPWLADSVDDVFWVVAGDVYTPEFDFSDTARLAFAETPAWARLWLVPNAPHHPGGDFGMSPEGLAMAAGTPRYTWSSIGLYRARMFSGLPVGQRIALRPLLDAAIAAGRVEAERYHGAWTDVGTPERLASLNRDDAPPEPPA